MSGERGNVRRRASGSGATEHEMADSSAAAQGWRWEWDSDDRDWWEAEDWRGQEWDEGRWWEETRTTDPIDIEGWLRRMNEEVNNLARRILQLAQRIDRLEQSGQQQGNPQTEGVAGGYRLCRNSAQCGLEFRIHRNHPNEQFCCHSCRPGNPDIHTDRCARRSRRVVAIRPLQEHDTDA